MEEHLERVKQAMVAYFGTDQRRIGHALRVTGFAEVLLRKEPGVRDVVIAAALLHDIGIPEAERKFGSSAGYLQEQEGPPVAREMLLSLGFTVPVIDEVCRIIASHHSPGEVDTANFHIIWDADWLVNLADEFDLSDREKIHDLIERVFLTGTGKALAQREFLPDGAVA